MIKRLISGITPDGGTQIAPGARRGVSTRSCRCARFTNTSCCSRTAFPKKATACRSRREALANKVTISTVGLGQDVNRAFLEKVASFAQGKSYFLNDPSGLEQILLRDVQEHTGTTSVEKADRIRRGETGRDPRRRGHRDGAGAERLRPIHGEAHGGHDPEGRRERSAAGPLAIWPGAVGGLHFRREDPLGGELGHLARIRSSLVEYFPRPAAACAGKRSHRGIRSRQQRNHRRLSPRPRRGGTGQDTRHFRLRSGRISSTAEGEQSGARDTTAASRHRSAAGPLPVRPLAESRAFPEIGLYRQEEEMFESGANEPLLQQLASATGGRFRPSEKTLFDPAGRSISSTMELWPGLLALAIIVNLVELFMRKWKGLAETLHLRHAEA